MMKALCFPPLRRDRSLQSGQATTEYVIIAFLGFLVGAALTHWAPDMLNALHIYLMGIYYVVGTPIG